MAFRTTVLNKRFYAVSTQDELWKPHFEAVMVANGFPAHHSYLLSGFYQLCVLATAQGVRLGRPNTRPCRHQVQGLRPNAQGTPRGRAGCPPGNIADTIAHDIPPVHAYNLPNPCWYVCWAVEAGRQGLMCQTSCTWAPILQVGWEQSDVSLLPSCFTTNASSCPSPAPTCG